MRNVKTGSRTIKKMRDALLEAEELLLLCDPAGDRLRAFVVNLPEDPEVRQLCERVGYGAVMDSAARQWRMKSEVEGHPSGAMTTGPVVGSVQRGLKMIRAALRGHRR